MIGSFPSKLNWLILAQTISLSSARGHLNSVLQGKYHMKYFSISRYYLGVMAVQFADEDSLGKVYSACLCSP